jgi:hypothetical protein
MSYDRDQNPQTPGSRSATATGPVQRSSDPGKRALTDGMVIQRRASSSAAPVQQLATGAEAAGAGGEAGVHAAAERGVATAASPLPHGDTIQRAFGRHDVSGVQAHAGGEAAASARAMGAEAYATGDHVVLGDRADLHTVAHEAAHVVQQRSGVALKGGVGEAGDPYEQHADKVADLVVGGQSAEGVLDQMAGGGRSGAGGAVQRFATGAAVGAADFTHISQNGKIVIKSPQEAYASDDMFAAANAGDIAVTFIKGPQLALPANYAQQYPNAGALYQLVPRMKAAGQGQKPSREQEASMAHSPVEGDSDDAIAKKHEVFKQYITELLAEIKSFVKDIDAATRKALGSQMPTMDTLVPGSLKRFMMDRVKPFIVGPKGQVLGPMLAIPIGGFENLASRAGAAVNPLTLVELNTWLGWFNSHYSAEAQKELESPASALALPNDCGSVSALVAGKSNMQANVAADPAIGQTFKVNYGDNMGPESWNVHWAAPVMKDGGDSLTLETGVQPGRFAGGKTFWTYQMYGSQGAQTFSAQTDQANTAHIANQQSFNANAKF